MTKRSIPALLREGAAELCSLVAPRECPCGADGAWLCPQCRRLLRATPVRVDGACTALQMLWAARLLPEHGLPAGADYRSLLPVLALGPYQGPLKNLVLAWKNGGAAHLTRPLGEGIAPAVSALGPRGVQLAAVPSRLAARLRRGEDHTLELARVLAAQGVGTVMPARAVVATGQEGRDARDRRERRIHLRPRPGIARARAQDTEWERSSGVVIVDDVVTTGSTLRAMHEALTSAGHQVLGAVVIAAARIPSPGP